MSSACGRSFLEVISWFRRNWSNWRVQFGMISFFIDSLFQGCLWSLLVLISPFMMYFPNPIVNFTLHLWGLAPLCGNHFTDILVLTELIRNISWFLPFNQMSATEIIQINVDLDLLLLVSCLIKRYSLVLRSLLNFYSPVWMKGANLSRRRSFWS